MLALLQDSIISQTDAAFVTLHECVRKSGPENWSLKIGNYQLGRVVFHALFFSDFFHASSESDFTSQPFHLQNQEMFEDYAEMRDVEPGPSPSRSGVCQYMDFCRKKVQENVLAQNEDSLQLDHHASWLDLNRAEVYLYNIRHLQHHAAQTLLRLRSEKQIEIPWVRAGRLEDLA